MGAVSTAQINLLVTARSEAQAVLTGTKSGVDGVTESVKAYSKQSGDAAKSEKSFQDEVNQSQIVMDNWARRLRTAQAEVSALTDAEKSAIVAAKQLGVANEDVAKTLMVSTEALNLYQQSMRKKTQVDDDSAKKTTGLGIGVGITAAAVLGAATAAGAYADRLTELSEQTGFGVVALQKYQVAAKTNGSSVEALSRSFGNFQNQLEAGSPKVSDALQKLGINIGALKDASPEEQMNTLAVAIAGVSDPTDRARIATELFGARGRQLIPTLIEIANHYGQLPALSEDMILKTGQLKNEIDLLTTSGTQMLVQLLGPLVGQIGTTREQFQTLLKIVPTLQDAFGYMFNAIGLGLTTAEKGVVDFAISIETIKSKLPGYTALFGDTLSQLKARSQGLSDLANSYSFAMDDLHKHSVELMASQSDQIKVITGTATATEGLTQKLQEQRNAVAQFTPEMRAAADAGKALGLSNKEVAESVSKVPGGFQVSAETIKVYEDALKSAAKAAKGDGSAAIDEFLKSLYKLDVEVQTAANNGTSWAAIVAKWGPQLVKAQQEAADLGVTVGDLGDDFITAMQKADQAHWDQVVAKQFAGIHSEAEKFYANQKKLSDQANKETLDTELAGNKESLSLQDKYWDERNKLTLTGTQLAIAQADQWATAEKAKLDQRASAYQTNVNEIEAIHALMVQNILRQTDPMFQMWNKLHDQVVSLGNDINTDFAKMLSGAESFHDGFEGIWDSIKKTATNVLQDILEYFEKVWIAKMTASLLGGGNIWSQIIGAALKSGVSSSVAGGVAQQVGGALITNAAYGTGAQSGAQVLMNYGTTIGGTGATVAAGHAGLAVGSNGISLGSSTLGWGSAVGYIGGPVAGGIIGFEVGKATGSKLEGAAAGAGAGAAVGSFAGPVGAGVGAGVGALAGLYGAHEANEDARNQMVDIRAQLQQTFGSLDNVRKAAQAVGVNIDQAFQDIGRGVNGVEDFNKVVSEFQDKYNALDGALQHYGLTLDQIKEQSKSAQDQMTDSAKTVTDYYTALTGAGLSPDSTIKTMAGDLNGLLAQAIATGTKLPATLEPYLDRMEQLGLITDDNKAKLLGLTGASSDDLQKASDIASKYGITLQQLGPKFEQAQISARAQQIYSDFSQLADMGVDVGGVLGGMSDEISAFVNDAIKAGAEVPENMRPILQELVDNKQLIGENGDALTDLSSIKFGAPMADEFAPVTDAIHDLINVLTGTGPGGLPNAFQNGVDQIGDIARNSKIQIPVGFTYETLDVPDLPKAAKGIYATGQGGVATWFGEGGEAEMGGPRSFMTDALQGVDWNKVAGFKAGDNGGKTINISMPLSVSPGTNMQQMMTWLSGQVMPALLKHLDNDGSARVNLQQVLGVPK